MAFTKVTGPGVSTTSNYRVGVLTATKFVGPMEASGTSDFTNINVTGIATVGFATATDVWVSGAVTATTFKGNLSGDIVGTRSLGTGVSVTAAGVVSATTYYGSGANLTGIVIDATQILTGNTSVQTVDTGSDGHVKVTTEGGERIRFGTAGQIGIAGANYGSSGQVLTSGGSGGAVSWGTISIPDADKIIEGNTTAEVVDTGSDGHFKVTTEGTERIRTDSSGRTGFGVVPNATFSENARITIQGTGVNESIYSNINGTGIGTHITLNNGSSARCRIGTNGTSLWLASNNNSEQLRLDPNGRLLLGGIGNTESDIRLYLHNSGAAGSQLQFTGNASGTGNSDGFRVGYNGSGGQLWLFENQYVRIATNNAERLRIDNNGKVLIATQTTSEAHTNNDELIIGSSSDDANHGLTIVTPNDHYGTVAFSDGSGGTGQGLLEYNHSGDYMRIYTAGSERFRIQNNGKVLINTTTPGATGANDLTLATTGSTGLTIRSGTSNDGNIFFSDATSGSAEYAGYIQYEHSNNVLRFGTAETEKFRIQSNGVALFGTTTAAPWTNRRLIVSDTTSAAATCLELRSATNGTGRVYFTDGTSGGADSYAGKIWYDHADDTMKINTGGNTVTPGVRFQIDATGRVTKPSQPGFAAYADGSYSTSDNTVLEFATAQWNTGNHYNTSTSTFTCPVAGKYYIYTQFLTDSSDNRCICYIQINSSSKQEISATTRHYNSAQGSLIWSCSANDTIRIYTGGSSYSRIYGSSQSQNWFIVYLLG